MPAPEWHWPESLDYFFAFGHTLHVSNTHLYFLFIFSCRTLIWQHCLGALLPYSPTTISPLDLYAGGTISPILIGHTLILPHDTSRTKTHLATLFRCMATVFAYNHLPSMPEGQFEEISKTLVSLYQEIKHNSIWVSIVLGIQLLLKKSLLYPFSSVWSGSKGQKSGSE